MAPLSAEMAFAPLAREILDFTYAHRPSYATSLGVHDYDDRLEDYSREGVEEERTGLHALRERLAALDAVGLSPEHVLDREFVLHQLDGALLTLEETRPWARDPDLYSSGPAQTAYVMIKRSFAPLEKRLQLLVARERAMPQAIAQARRNLDDPPRIFTEIALQQLDGTIDLFATTVPAAFGEVHDTKLLAEFKAANDAVIAALRDYKTWLQNDLLPRSRGEFALGTEVYRKKLWYEEMIDTPLPELLAIAEADLHRNQEALVSAARAIDPARSPRQVLDALELDHPRADQLLRTTQQELDALADFIRSHGIVTLPPGAAVRVEETPSFLRATTSASMDSPGPLEKLASEAYYNMTLPDPSSSAPDQAEFMKQWYYAAISNVSVHEVWPGHYLQFLYLKDVPSELRKVFGAASNSEGWAHYCEQMMLDEGLHAGEPKYRLAQIQDALLRDARFIVGIKLHTQGMTLEQAREFFVAEGYQPAPVADSETKRGTSDATYGYYTMGKRMILKLRDDYRARQGEAYSLQAFHDRFLELGPLPLPLMRRAMLGETGTLF